MGWDGFFYLHVSAMFGQAAWFATASLPQTTGWIAVLDEVRVERAVGAHIIDVRWAEARRAAGIEKGSAAEWLAVEAAEKVIRAPVSEACVLGYIDARALGTLHGRPSQKRDMVKALTPWSTRQVASQLMEMQARSQWLGEYRAAPPTVRRMVLATDASMQRSCEGIMSATFGTSATVTQRQAITEVSAWQSRHGHA